MKSKTLALLESVGKITVFTPAIVLAIIGFVVACQFVDPSKLTWSSKSGQLMKPLFSIAAFFQILWADINKIRMSSSKSQCNR